MQPRLPLQKIYSNKKQKGCQQAGGCRPSLVSKRVFGTLAAEFEVFVFACLNGDQNISKKKYTFFCHVLVLLFSFFGNIWASGLGDDGQRFGKGGWAGRGAGQGGRGGERLLSCSELRVSFG